MTFAPWPRVRLVVVSPPGYAHAAGLDEVVESLVCAFRALGCRVDVATNQPIGDGVNILFLAHLLDAQAAPTVPAGAILYNFEQIFDGAPVLTPTFLELVRRFEVWDYSRKNLKALREALQQRYPGNLL